MAIFGLGFQPLGNVIHMAPPLLVRRPGIGITPATCKPGHSCSKKLRFAEGGLQGIIVAHMTTRQQADAITRTARGNPNWHRGIGGRVGAHDRGAGLSRDETTVGFRRNVWKLPG